MLCAPTVGLLSLGLHCLNTTTVGWLSVPVPRSQRLKATKIVVITVIDGGGERGGGREGEVKRCDVQHVAHDERVTVLALITKSRLWWACRHALIPSFWVKWD